MESINVLSFGAGVQSTTIFLMMIHGIIPKADHIIFADTGWEPKAVYNHLDWCKKKAEEHGMKIEIVKYSNIKEDIIKCKNEGKTFASMPFFTKTLKEVKVEIEQDNNQISFFEIEEINSKLDVNYIESFGMVMRQCTNKYKVQPIRKICREYLGIKFRERAKGKYVNMIMGISSDEFQRVKKSTDSFINNVYPLIDLNFTRNDCLDWLKKFNYPIPPKSACIGCPFHDNETWLEMKKNDIESWNDAVEVDNMIRNLPIFKGEAFLHRSYKPLSEIELDENQLELNDFINECTGHCGV